MPKYLYLFIIFMTVVQSKDNKEQINFESNILKTCYAKHFYSTRAASSGALAAASGLAASAALAAAFTCGLLSRHSLTAAFNSGDASRITARMLRSRLLFLEPASRPSTSALSYKMKVHH